MSLTITEALKVKPIDLHTHPAPTPPRITPAHMRMVYDRLGIDRCVAFSGLISKSEAFFETDAFANEHPDVFAGWFCNPSELIAEGASAETIIGYLKQSIAKGASGYGEMTVHVPINSPSLYPMYAFMEQSGLPMTVHFAAERESYGMTDDLHLPGLETVLKRFPNFKILGHASAFWSEITGDVTEETHSAYGNGKVTPGGRVIELMRRYDNLWGDLSAGSACFGISRDPAHGYAFLKEFADRLYYGSDLAEDTETCEGHPTVKMLAFLREGLKDGHISPEDYQKIMRGNAEKLLGL